MNLARRYQDHLRLLRGQASFRSGDERKILLGWAGLFEHHINRMLTKPGLSPNDLALTLQALKNARGDSEDHLDDIMTLKASPWMTPEEIAACGPRYAAIVADAPWALPTAVKPKGQWGGKR